MILSDGGCGPSLHLVNPAAFDLRAFYDDYVGVEDEFGETLDGSLAPRGPELLYDVVADLELRQGATALDVGCGEGEHSVTLAQRFGLTVFGIDPIPRHVAVARELLASRPDLAGRVAFAEATADRLPVSAGSVDLLWCRDVLVHVPELEPVYAEFRRVLTGRDGRAVVYQTFTTDRLEPREADWLFTVMGVIPSSADADRTEQAVATAGLRVDARIELGSEWGEYAQERGGSPGRRLLHAARLVRDPARYVDRFGQAAYDIALGDCLWHVYRMIGKLAPRVYVLSVA